VALSPGGALNSPAEAAVGRIADRYLEALLEHQPDEGTRLGLSGARHDGLPDRSPEGIEAWHVVEDGFLSELEELSGGPPPPGSPAEITREFLLEILRGSRGQRLCRMELWNVSGTFSSWPSQMATLAQLQPVRTALDGEAALERFAQLPRLIDQEIQNLERGLGLGFSAVAANVHAGIRQVSGLLEQPIEASPFVGMAPPGRAELRARLERLEREELRPAFERYRGYLVDSYLPRARPDGGIGNHPEGRAAYRAAVRAWATVDPDPEEIHRLGLERMDLIQAQMQEVSDRSFGGLGPSELLRVLRVDERYLLGGRDQLLRVARDAVDRAGRALPLWFGRVPAAGIEVRPVPEFAEAGAPSAYYTPPAGESGRPGIYHLNLRDAEHQPLAGVESTAFHEAHPGHHTQIALAQEREGLHPVQRYFFLSGFGEGWALYAERLSDEMGLFTSDVDRMGLLSNEALRAARLVVDTGLHALGWPRERAIAYMSENTAEDPASVEAEVSRYLAAPGQATSYMLGCVEFEELRARAEAELGGAFDVRAFHDELLARGSLPLGTLRTTMERWIAAGGPPAG